MTAPDAPDLHALGIEASDTDLLAAASAEPTIAAEAAIRRAEAKRNPPRLRPGPLLGAERALIVSEAVGALRRDLFALLAATDGLNEVSSALAAAGLELRRFPPGADTLAAQLQKNLV